ncbi:MAG: helix-turn-helix transcriptional regulator [Lachnospiraceae bacterium]|nr:helix-turn-helix transcriptional regulator [Lachnospiraceae bacterium]
MILADKIIMLRKKYGWSQEDLAAKLGISRQSVSKWESAASVPDLDKIIKLSQLFGVSTDYLLKDEIEETENDPWEDGEEDRKEAQGRLITLEQANKYLGLSEKMALRTAFATAVCILSPVALIILAGLAEAGIGLSEDLAGGLGLVVLLVLVAGAVASFVWDSMQMEEFKYIEEEDFQLQYGIAGMVEKKQEAFRDVHRKCVVVGVTLCILSVIPLVCLAIIYQEDMAAIMGVAILLLLIACAVFLFVWSETISESYQKLMQEGKYSPEGKRESKRNSPISGIYWSLITAVYLGISFYTMRWDRTWIIWPSAGVLYSVVCGFVSVFRNSGSGE